MPAYEVKAPDGKTYRVNAPDGATEAQAIEYVQKNFYAPESPLPAPKAIGKDAFGEALADVVSEQNPVTAAIAQAGNTAMKYARGIKQLFPQETKLSDVIAPQPYKGSAKDTIFGMRGMELDALDAEIKNQYPVAHAVGDIGAQVGLTYLGAKALPLKPLAAKAPALALTNPYVLNMATGAALGAGQVGTAEERATGGALGAGGGAFGTLVGRAIPAVYHGVKGLIEPFTKRGQENIVGRTMQRFAVDPSKVEAAGSYASSVPGVNPTLAEAALDPGISNLQRQFAVGMTDQQLKNNAARVNALRGIGGSEAQLAAAKSARESAVNGLYASADKATVQGDQAFNELLKRPSMRQASGGAARNAAERGEQFMLKRGEAERTVFIDPDGNPYPGVVPKPPAEPKFKSVLADIQDAGGISQSELSELGLGVAEANRLRPGLFRKEGMTGDSLLETLQQKGWVTDADISHADQVMPGGAQELAKDMIRSALNKEPVYHPADWELAYGYQQAMDDYVKQWGGFAKQTIAAKPAEYSGKTLHDLKLGLDDVINKTGDKGLHGNAKRYALGTKDDYLNWLDSKIPEYGKARTAFADMSKPINSMEVGNELIKRSTSAAEDALGNPTLRNEALSRSVRDGDAIAQRVTGFNKATLGGTLDSTAKQTLLDVRRDLARKTAAENLGRAAGSPTAQNLAAQNVMRQIAGPLGAPAGFAEANIWPTLLRPVNWVMKAQDPKIEAKLIEALQDPKLAAELIKRRASRPITGGLLGSVENYAIPAIASGLLNGRQ